MKTENEVMNFEFSEEKHQMQATMVGLIPYFVAKDICTVLEIDNVTKALYGLDKDEKLTLPIVRSGQTRNLNMITESGMYALILRSNKPEAKKFRKWITSEVIPSLRKSGVYKINNKQSGSFIDYRLIGHRIVQFNGGNIRVVDYEDKQWNSIMDFNRTMKTTTNTSQQVKTLGDHAKKFWICGNTHPSWFTDSHGLNLLLLGNRTIKPVQGKLF